ncbi:RNA-directed DNA polymerase [Acidobacteria bacterium AB60]|nr:RNA-directed DNA polymerase [Acidobacteria bacterium AB60]
MGYHEPTPAISVPARPRVPHVSRVGDMGYHEPTPAISVPARPREPHISRLLETWDTTNLTRPSALSHERRCDLALASRPLAAQRPAAILLMRRSAPSWQGKKPSGLALTSLGLPQGNVAIRALVAGASLRSHADQLPPGQTRWSTPLAPRLSKSVLIRALATAFLHGEPTTEELIQRAAHTLGRNWRWLRPVARRFVERFAGKVRPTRRSVLAFLREDENVNRTWHSRRHQLTVASWVVEPDGPAAMQPMAAAADWPIPAIATVGDLARWLGLTMGDLEWFSDPRRLTAKTRTPTLQHYHYRVFPKSSGGFRLIEAPKFRLKKVQRQILHEILDRVPTHAAVHGFVPGRSIKTFASLHAGKQVVLRIDLREFFPSIGRPRVQALFRTMGYPDSVAGLLSGLCTNATPRRVWREGTAQPSRSVDPAASFEAAQFYARPHLPQGAPASPALANLCAFRLDSRLQGLANAAGATYARYADDLAFSGDAAFARSAERFAARVAAIAEEEGWTVNHRKTRIMRQGVRQHLVGLVTNTHANVRRADFDRLKAILTNCGLHDPATQNRENHPAFRAHLEGRVSFVESINPGKGRRLRALFDRIVW